MKISQIQLYENYLLQSLLGPYPVIIEKIGISKIWNILYSIQLCTRNLSNIAGRLITYALEMVKKKKNILLPPNVLAFLYPNISFSKSNLKWCVPNQLELSKINYLLPKQKQLKIKNTNNKVRKILKVKRKI